MIEKFIFEDGTSLGFGEVLQKVIDNAKTDGEDVIYGHVSANSIAGGKGNDLLIGLQGPDTYVFGRGDGHDVIRDNNITVNWFSPDLPDTLRFKDDIRWTDIEFLRNGRDDDLTLKVRGTNDAVTIEDFMSYLPIFLCYPYRIETLEFGGGVNWDWLKLVQHYVAIAKTAGDDEVYGFNVVGDLLDGGAGNDLLQGLQGNDGYVFARGYGEDTVWDVYRTSNPLTETPEGIDRLLMRDINFFDVDISRTALDFHCARHG
jgi:Ca2+-binding RTX toxin-like protein